MSLIMLTTTMLLYKWLIVVNAQPEIEQHAEYDTKLISSYELRRNSLLTAKHINSLTRDNTTQLSTNNSEDNDTTYIFYKIDNKIVDVDRLTNLYKSESEFNNLVVTCVDFLYYQMGVEKEITAGIVGNVCCEGLFGQQQKTCLIADNYDTYVEWLDRDDDKGYGIAQWTSEERQQNLKQRLNEVVDFFVNTVGLTEESVKYGENFTACIITTELSFLYDEIQSYRVFTSYDAEYTVEDATGRMAVIYEAYKHSNRQWQKYNGEYRLALQNSHGAERLDWANYTYEYIQHMNKNATL